MEAEEVLEEIEAVLEEDGTLRHIPHKVVRSRNSLELCWELASSHPGDLLFHEGGVKIAIKFDFGSPVNCPIHSRSKFCCSPTITLANLSMPRSPNGLSSARFVLVKNCDGVSNNILSNNTIGFGEMTAEIGSSCCKAGPVVCVSESRFKIDVHFHLVLEASGLFNVCDSVTLRDHGNSRLCAIFDDHDSGQSDVTIVSADGGHEINVRWWLYRVGHG